MKLSAFELGGIGLLIVYVAFFTHPPPALVTSLLSTPVGHGVVLLLVLYLAVYHSMILGLFLGIAYIMSSSNTIEYLDAKEQSLPKKEKPQPKASGIPPAAITGMLSAMTGKKKGDTRIPQTQGKDDTTKPTLHTPPKPAAPEKIENFSVF
jgi:hypothetical protein